jgi:hypothetical protein
MHRQLLAQFHRRGLVAQSGDEEFHAAAAQGGSTMAKARPARQGWPNLAI